MISKQLNFKYLIIYSFFGEHAAVAVISVLQPIHAWEFL